LEQRRASGVDYSLIPKAPEIMPNSDLIFAHCVLSFGSSKCAGQYFVYFVGVVSNDEQIVVRFLSIFELVDHILRFLLKVLYQSFSVAANRHAGQVGYSPSPPQEVRHGQSSLRADPGEKGEGQAAHAAACAARERERQSDLPVLWRFPVVVLHLEEAL
jgi:hypothetical protein